MLDVSSTTSGFLPPRMTTTQRDAIASPVSGMMIYNTTTSRHETYVGSSWTIVGASGSTVSPAGLVAPFSMSSCPSGWLAADGSAVSRATYAALFAAVGTTFGAGDGSTTFNLPELRGEFIRGWDNGRGVDAGRAFGSAQAGSQVTVNWGKNGGGWQMAIADLGTPYSDVEASSTT